MLSSFPLDAPGFQKPSDELLDFVRRRGDNTRLKHVAIYRIESKFLLAVKRLCVFHPDTEAQQN
jgi:hypothetical protein